MSTRKPESGLGSGRGGQALRGLGVESSRESPWNKTSGSLHCPLRHFSGSEGTLGTGSPRAPEALARTLRCHWACSWTDCWCWVTRLSRQGA